MVWAPDTASETGLSAYAGDNHQARFSDYSQAGFERGRLLRLDLLEQLGRRPVLPIEHPLARDLVVTTDAYVRLAELQAVGHGRLSLWDTVPFAMDPFGGVWISGLDLLSNTHRVATLADAEAFVARLAALAGAVADTKRRLMADAESGIVAPRTLLQQQKTLVDALLSDTSPTLNNVISDLENLMLSVTAIDALARERLLLEADLIIEQDLRSAYADLSATLEDLLQVAPAQPGLWVQQSERDLYRSFLSWRVSELPDDLATLHQENLTHAQTERLAFDRALDPLLPIAEQESDTDATAASPVSQELLELVFASDDVETETLFVPSELTQRSALDEDLVSVFGVALKPRAVDGSRPNLLVINAQQLELWPSWLKALLLSRAFHQPDTELADATLASAGRSPVRALISSPALRAGWASDQQRLVAEQGRLDPLQVAAWRHWLLVEAALATVDTGIHIERWTADAAVEYLIDQALLSEPIAQSAVRYIAGTPGQFTARQIGARRIASLRVRAQAILSDAYSESDFGNIVLSDGDRPYNMLVADVESWYEAQLGAP